MYMILFVLENTERLGNLLEAWKAVGVNGATILESTGMYRKQTAHVPMRYLIAQSGSEHGNLTVFAIVPDEEVVQNCLRATQQVVGDLADPRTGVFAAWQLDFAAGIPKRSVGR
ncbi:MAG TPA: hypothetical protein VIO61_05490 [Anaerolineaceae bacterium]